MFNGTKAFSKNGNKPRFGSEEYHQAIKASGGETKKRKPMNKRFKRCYTLDVTSDQMFRFNNAERKSKASDNPPDKNLSRKLEYEENNMFKTNGWGLILNYVSGKDEKSQVNKVIKDLNDTKKNFNRSKTSVSPARFLQGCKKISVKAAPKKNFLYDSSLYRADRNFSTKKINAIKEDLSKMTEDFENHSHIIQSLKDK